MGDTSAILTEMLHYMRCLVELLEREVGTAEEMIVEIRQLREVYQNSQHTLNPPALMTTAEADSCTDGSAEDA